MDRLIKKVRNHPCLWDVNHVSFKDNSPKDFAWEQVAKECGMKNGLEAKFHWKKLRGSHREALRRRRINSKVKKPWKYEEQMKFLVPETDTSIEIDSKDSNNEEEYDDGDADMASDDTAESPCLSPSHTETEADSKVAIEMLQDTRPRYMLQDEIRSHLETGQQDALSILFESLCQKTRELPKYLQLRVQREVFESVLRAEEDALSLDPLAAVHSSHRSTSSYGPSSSTTN